MPNFLPRNPPPLTAVGCHIYAGGFTLGAVKHFEVLAHLERTGYGRETIEANFPGLPIHVSGEAPASFLDEDEREEYDAICQALARSGSAILESAAAAYRKLDRERYEAWLARAWNLDAYRGCDCVYGNPPCAPFSVNNKSGIPWQDDPRIGDIKSEFALLGMLRPRVWIWESVRGAYTKGKSLVEELTREANALGYNVSYVLFDAQWLGIPQRRRRFFFVAHDVELPWHLTEIHPSPPTVGEWLARLDPSQIGEPFHEAFKRHAYLIPKTPPGKSLRVAFDAMIESGEIKRELNAQGQVAGRPSWGGVRLDADTVAPTMVGYGWAHPYEDRPLSLKEMQWLSTFPPEYEVLGTGPTSLIARGVLPAVGDWILGIAAQGILANRKVRDPGAVEVDLKQPILRYHQIKVPRRQLELAL